jgi:hypothetical protein
MLKRWCSVFAIMTVVLLVTAGGQAQIMKPDEALARSVVADLAGRKFDAVVAHFGEPIKNMMSAATLGKMWESVTKTYGEFQSIESVKSEQVADLDIVMVACKLQKSVVTVILKIDKKRLVTDLRISFPMAPTS